MVFTISYKKSVSSNDRLGKVLLTRAEQIGLNGKKGFFALKVLNTYTPDEKAMIAKLFENERKQLNRFNGVAHNHLVTLLAAFEQEGVGKSYFVFPWAECDLSAYWERTDHRDARWVSEQLAGLMGALNEIHNPAQNSQTLGAQVYGRHGDLKPDNILWFTPYRGDPRGILVVSDMGFTAVNSELSRSKQTNGKPRTPTYRPPELDIQGANVTREYDVWSMGCIFLEMITWLLGGHDLNIDFKTQRTTTESSGVNTPVFFTFVEGQPVVKEEVIDVSRTLRISPILSMATTTDSLCSGSKHFAGTKKAQISSVLSSMSSRRR